MKKQLATLLICLIVATGLNASGDNFDVGKIKREEDVSKMQEYLVHYENNELPLNEIQNYAYFSLYIESQKNINYEETLSKIETKIVELKKFNHVLIADFMLLKAKLLLKNNDITLGIAELQNVIEFYNKNNNFNKMADCYYLLAEIYYKHSLFNKALINLQKLIEESQNIDKKDIIVKSYKLMGDIYSKLFLFREADRFYNETLTLVEDNNFDIPFIEELYHNYSKNSINLENIESAHEYIIKGVYLCKTSNNNNCFSRFKILESIILKKENSFEQAIQVLEQAEKELNTNNSIYRDILFQKFEIYSLLFDIEKLDHIITLINNFHENSSIDNIEYFKILHDYYEIKKDDKKALFYLNKYHNAYKNKFRYELLERISELKTVLDFKVEIEKNKALEVVNKKNEILLAQKENINQLQTILIIIVSISLVMLGGFTLKIFHNKKQFKFLSETDNLTKINNRRSITNIAENLYNEKNNFSVILFDIDHFKKVNDTFGHNVGDEVLKIISKLTKKTLRDTDYVGRYGGEEFLIILPNTEILKAKEIAERIRLKIQNYDYSDIERKLNTTSSFGVSHYDPSLSLKDIIIEADKKLYYSKDNGRNKVS